MPRPFLLFDAYGTLVELDNFYIRLERAFAQRGVCLPRDVIQRAAHREMRHYMANTIHVRDEVSWLALRRDCAGVLADAVREQGHDLKLSCDETLQVLTEALVFYAFPEVRGTLDALQRLDIPLAVLSNWDYGLRSVLESVGLEDAFQFVLTSAEAGVEKPDPAFFARGLDRARANRGDLSSRDCFYVGDHYEKDVLAARRAGLTPVWLVRDQRDLASGDIHEAEDAVIRLNCLSDLLQVPSITG